MKSGTVESRMSGFIGTPAISCDSSVSCPRPNELTEPLSNTALLDDLIHLQQHRPGDRQSERSRRPEIDDELELGWLLDGQGGGVGALKGLVAGGWRVDVGG